MNIALVPFVLAVVLNMALGMLWYSPKLMGRSWAIELGFNLNEMKLKAVDYIGALVVTIVTVLVTGFLVFQFKSSNFFEATKLAMLLWLGFIVTSHFSSVIWAKKPLKVYIIDVGFFFFTTWINSLLFSLW